MLNNLIFRGGFGVVLIQLIGEKHLVKLLLTALLLILLHLGQSCRFKSSKIRYKITLIDFSFLLKFFTCCTIFVPKQIIFGIVQVPFISVSLIMLIFLFPLIFSSIHKVSSLFLMTFTSHSPITYYHDRKHFFRVLFSQGQPLNCADMIGCSQGLD